MGLKLGGLMVTSSMLCRRNGASWQDASEEVRVGSTARAPTKRGLSDPRQGIDRAPLCAQAEPPLRRQAAIASSTPFEVFLVHLPLQLPGSSGGWSLGGLFWAARALFPSSSWALEGGRGHLGEKSPHSAGSREPSCVSAMPRRSVLRPDCGGTCSFFTSRSRRSMFL